MSTDCHDGGCPVRPDDGVSQASAYLRLLLAQPGDYRTAWERHVEPGDRAGISYTGVAGVLRAAGTVSDPHLVARQSLEGTALAAEHLELFVSAFGIAERQARRLRDLHRGSGAVRVLEGAASGQLPLVPPGPARYETIALHETHTLGPDGRPAEHQTIQTIRALIEGLDRYPYQFDTDQLVVDVVRGGVLDHGRYRINDRFHAVDILLGPPLHQGESTLLHLRTTFAYRDPPAPHVRRAVRRSVQDLTLWVRFHPRRVPRRVWQARWDLADPSVLLSRHEVDLDPELSVRARFGPVERTIVGFAWEWERSPAD